MDFTYVTGLDSNELRLLLPVSTSRHTLYFEILSIPRALAPPYTAVSYTWGDDEASEVIYLNGRAFQVRPNLWSCLYYLSLDTRRTAWKYLWVDAICIDQTNDAERSAQVRLMDQKYRDSACVSVWLGLVTLPEGYRSRWHKHLPIKTLETDGFNWREMMADLANRPYWSRFWVIQEFLLGGNVELCCSDNRMNWLNFQTILCDEAGVKQFSDGHDSNTRNGTTALYSALPLVMGRHIDKHPEILQPLHDLLVNHRRSKCKDPRDRVFALLGLIPRYDRGLLGRFFPDYTMTQDHVLIITLAHLTQYSHKTITPDSEELFLGLGVELKAQRRRLLRRAERFDYLDDGPPSALLRVLAFHDEMEEYQGVDLEENYEMGQIESSRPGRARRVVVSVSLVGFLGFATIFWLYRWWVGRD